MNNTKMIYILRSQCEKCKLDKMDVFYRIPNVTPSELIRELKREIRKKFKQTYKCTHTVKFTREIDKDYLWDVDQNKAIKRGSL